MHIYRANKNSPIKLHRKLTRLIVQRLSGALINWGRSLASLEPSNYKKTNKQNVDNFIIIIIP